MLLWILFALLTAAALAAVLAPLARPASHTGEDGAGAQSVYRHQLAELDAERAQGLLGAEEATAARLEIARRLLASAAVSERNAARPERAHAGRAGMALALGACVPLLTIALYLIVGSPGLPSFAEADRARLSLETAGIDALLAKVEAQLRQHPDDGKGWDVIAPVYLKIGRFREAADAFTRAVRLEGESVRRLAGLAAATIRAADGLVGDDARGACERILELDPTNSEARFWLALAKEQEGALADALAGYRALLAEAPGDAPWRAALEARVAELDARQRGKPGPNGPSLEDMAAAQGLSAEARAQMIGEMVERLAERLRRDGNDLAGWRRLINAYSVLGRAGDAKSALNEARKQFQSDQRALGELATLAASLGLGS